MIRLKYIQNTGTQWIDTLVNPADVKRYEIDATWDARANDGSSIFMGGFYQSATSILKKVSPLKCSTTGLVLISYSSANSDLTPYPNVYWQFGERHKVMAVLKDGLQQLYFDGAKIYENNLNLGEIVVSATMSMLAYDYNGSHLTGYGWSGKIYSVKIYDGNDTLIRDFIPALDDNNVPCFYDAVGDQYYYNQGTGTFSYSLFSNTNMITDRTQVDVDELHPGATITSKGAYNYTDLNRVEDKVKELNEILISYRYMNEELVTKLDWTLTDKFNESDSQRYLGNVQKIRNALVITSTTPDVPATMHKLTYEQANNIEKILVDIETLIIGIQGYFVYSGVSNSGQVRLWQNRFRRLNILVTESDMVLITEDGERLEA